MLKMLACWVVFLYLSGRPSSRSSSYLHFTVNVYSFWVLTNLDSLGLCFGHKNRVAAGTLLGNTCRFCWLLASFTREYKSSCIVSLKSTLNARKNRHWLVDWLIHTFSFGYCNVDTMAMVIIRRRHMCCTWLNVFRLQEQDTRYSGVFISATEQSGS